MGLLGDAYQTVAGVYDHMYGSVDESFGRQFDDQEGGGFADGVVNYGNEVDSIANSDLGAVDRFTTYSQVTFEAVFGDDASDLAFEGDWNGEDTTDLFGPSVTGDGSVTDVLVDNDGEDRSGELRTKLFLWTLVAAAALYLLGPAFDFGAALLDDGEDA
jgi:hypothetical protein